MTTLLDLVLSRHLTPAPRKVAGTHGGEWHGPCPKCGGSDRFHFWPERRSTGSCSVPGVWGCRSCDISGDAIAFLMHMDGLTFKDACARLGQTITPAEYRSVSLPKHGPSAQSLAPVDPSLPPVEWRERNGKLVATAHTTLLETPDQLAWLAARGIDREAVIRYRLGWLPGERGQMWYTRPRKSWGLPEEEGKGGTIFRFPRGLVIPRHKGASVVCLRIRRPDADRAQNLPKLKYMAFRGTRTRPLLALPETPLDRSGLAVVESELDAILLAETARRSGLACGALAIVSNTANPDAAAHAACARAATLLLALDFDPSGTGGRKSTDAALARWLATYPRAKDWPLPQGKDPGEAFAQGVDLALWLAAGLPPICLPAPASAQVPGVPASGEPAQAPAAPVAQTGPPPQEIPPATAKRGEGAEQPSQAIPADVLTLHNYMRRYPLRFKVEASRGFFEIVSAQKWRRDNWDLFTTITDLIYHSADVSKWLDTHPVQSGVIDRDNLLKR